MFEFLSPAQHQIQRRSRFLFVTFSGYVTCDVHGFDLLTLVRISSSLSKAIFTHLPCSRHCQNKVRIFFQKPWHERPAEGACVNGAIQRQTGSSVILFLANKTLCNLLLNFLLLTVTCTHKSLLFYWLQNISECLFW